MRKYLGCILLTCLVSVSQADSVKTEDGHQATTRNNGADIEEVRTDPLANRTIPPENPSPPGLQSAEYWERQGYADGSRNTGSRTALAAAGGCIGVPVGGFLGLLANGTSEACLLGAAVGGGSGCLGGRELGSLGQREAVSPTPDSAFRDAYLRGHQRATLLSDGLSAAAGTGGVLVSAAALYGLFVIIIRSAWAN